MDHQVITLFKEIGLKAFFTHVSTSPTPRVSLVLCVPIILEKPRESSPALRIRMFLDVAFESQQGSAGTPTAPACAVCHCSRQDQARARRHSLVPCAGTAVAKASEVFLYLSLPFRGAFCFAPHALKRFMGSVPSFSPIDI